MSKLDEARLAYITQEDIVIAVMGPAGSGKSTFINVATGRGLNSVDHSLDAAVCGIRPIRFSHLKCSRPIVFLDTPGLGLGSNEKSDVDVMSMVSNWINTNYRGKTKLAGVIYLHRISDNRLAKSPLINLHLLANLCGKEGAKNVILVTTMWDPSRDLLERRREIELKQKYWKWMLDNGSRATRFDGTFESAWKVVNRFVKKGRAKGLLLRDEMLDLQRQLGESELGNALYSSLQRLLVDEKEVLSVLREESETQCSPELARELTAQYEKNQEALRRTFARLQHMQVIVGAQILTHCPKSKGLGAGFRFPSRHN